jgi:hypothetical protein
MPPAPQPRLADCGGWWTGRTSLSATEAALPAISESLADGISVNVTLIFSIERYKAVLEAFLTGLEKRKSAGNSLNGIESVASFFISRVDRETDRRLSEVEAKGGELGATAQRLRGQTAIANATSRVSGLRRHAGIATLAGSSGRRRASAAAPLGVHGVKERRSAIRATSSTSSPLIRSTPCRPRPYTPCRTMASFMATLSAGAMTRPGTPSTSWAAWGSIWRMSRKRLSDRASLPSKKAGTI